MKGLGDEAWPPEPSPEVYEHDELRMERAHGCFRDLSWRVSGHERSTLSAEDLARALVDVGLEDRSRSPLVREFVSPDEDVLVFVPKTRRLELRIWGARPYEERFPAAASLLGLAAKALISEGAGEAT